MKTTMFKRVFAAIMLVMVLVSALSVSALAAPTSFADCSKVKDDKTTAWDEAKVCTRLQEIYGKTSSMKYDYAVGDECKYASSIEINGTQVTIYLSSKPGTEDVGVQMGDDGKLVIDGISSDDTSAWNQLFDRFKGVIVGLTGVGTLVMIVLFIIQFMKLGSSAGNPQARSQALTGVLWTGVAAALLGSVTIIVGFFYNAL